MRLGRIILAGLAPLVGLSAFIAGLAPDAQNSSRTIHIAAADSLPLLLQAFAPLLTSGADAAQDTHLENRHGHAVLALQALNTTPLGGSLYLLAPTAAVDLSTRRHQRALLRC